jgi:urease subunit alpha
MWGRVVLWRPSHFGVKPEVVVKAGQFAWGALGQGNATIERAEPVRYGPHWGVFGAAAATVSTTFVSRAALESGIRQRLGSRRRFAAVHGTRTVTRRSLVHNTATPAVRLDPADGTVSLNGRVLAADPVGDVPLSRRYLLG